MLSIDVGWGGALPAGVLALTGNGQSDSVTVVGRATYVDVFVNNNFRARLQTANAAKVSEIRFSGGGGNDSLTVQGIQPRGTLAIGSVGHELSGVENLSVVNGYNVAVHNGAGPLNFAASKFSGALSVNSAGSLTQTGAIIAVGATTLVATAADIVLTHPANNFSTVDFNANTVAGQNVAIADVNGVIFAASEATGNLAVFANLNSTNRVAIMQTGALTAGGSTTLTVGPASTIKLDNAGNDFHGAGGSISVAAGANATLRDGGSLDLGPSTLSGNLTVTAGGPITDSGSLIVGKIATFSAAGHDITLDEANNFRTAAATGAAVAINDVDAIILGSSSVAGPLSVTAGGAIAQSGPINVVGETTLAAGSVNDIALANAANDFSSVRIVSGHDVSLRDKNAITLTTLSDSTVSGSLTVTAVGLIGQGTGNLLATAGKTTLKTTGNIALANPGNNFNEVAVASAAVVSLSDADALVLGTSKISSALTVQTGGDVTQSGALAVKSGTATLSAGGSDIALDNAGNDFKTVIVASGRDVAIRDANAIVLGAVAVSGDLNVKANLNPTSRLAISQTGPLSVGGSTTLEVGPTSSMTLDAATNRLHGPGGEVSVVAGANATLKQRSGGVLRLGASNLTGRLTAATGGAAGDHIVQSGPLNVAKAATLAAGAGDITLDDADNDLGTLAVSGARHVRVNDASALVLGASKCDTLTVTADGAITQSGALTPKASVRLSAGAVHDIVLLHALNDLVSIGIDSARNVSLRNAGPAALELASSTISGALNVTAAGGISEAVGAAVDVAGKTTLSVPIDKDVLLNEPASNNFGEVAVMSGRHVTLGTRDALILGPSTISGNLRVQLDHGASGGVTQNGALTVAGETALDAGSHDIVLANPANNFASLRVVDAANVQIRDINAIVLGNGVGGVTTAGNLDVTAGAAIIGDNALVIGGLTTLTTSAVADIILDSANSFAGAVSVISAYNVAIAAAERLTLGSSNVSGALALTLSAAGDLDQIGALTVAGTTTVNARNVDLTHAGNDFSTVSVTTGAGGGVSLVDLNDLVLGAMSVAGDLRVTVNGSIADSGVVAVALTTTLRADADGNSAGDIRLDSASSYAGKLSVLGGVQVDIYNVVPTVLGDFYVIGDLTITGEDDLTNFDGATYGVLNVVGDATLDIGPNDMSLRLTGWTYGSLSLIFGSLTIL